MKQYYPDQPELSDGYVVEMKKRSDEILASLSPNAREIALLLAENFKRNYK
jgi:hypothetical protein